MAKSFASITPSLLVLFVSLGFAADAAIPRDLHEAHESLTQHFSAADISRIRKMKSEDEMIGLVGLQEASALTNEWQLWADSPLARYFKRLGVTEPHDMIGIVADTYWCKLHGRPFALRAKVAKLRKEYARQEAMKPKGKSPRDGAEIDWFDIHSGKTTDIYLGVSKSDGSFWRYDHSNGRGIEPALPDEAKEMTTIIESTKHLK
jgi:hypothetical protein